MPQEPAVVASMTNSGVINLYDVPEICQEEFKADTRLKSKLTGLAAESFALHWNPTKKGLLTSCAEKLIAVWDINKGSEATVKFSEAHVENINDVRFATHPS